MIYAFGDDTAAPIRLSPELLASAPRREDNVTFRRLTFIIGF
jgi:hypothetical protein